MEPSDSKGNSGRQGAGAAAAKGFPIDEEEEGTMGRGGGMRRSWEEARRIKEEAAAMAIAGGLSSNRDRGSETQTWWVYKRRRFGSGADHGWVEPEAGETVAWLDENF